MEETKLNYEIKEADHVLVITLFNKEFATFADALQAISGDYKDRSILMVQSIEKENEPFKIVVVFDF